MKKVYCGFGHRDLLVNIEEELNQILENLISEKGVDTFFIGEQGDFDKIFSTCVRKFKIKYPYISLILIIPYLTKEIALDKEFYKDRYDEIILYSSDKKVHPKAAFSLRNRYMVDSSDFVIAYLYRSHGGAYDAVNYANKQKKEVVYIKKVRCSVY